MNTQTPTQTTMPTLTCLDGIKGKPRQIFEAPSASQLSFEDALAEASPTDLICLYFSPSKTPLFTITDTLTNASNFFRENPGSGAILTAQDVNNFLWAIEIDRFEDELSYFLNDVLMLDELFEIDEAYEREQLEEQTYFELSFS